MTLALECGLLTPLYCTSFADVATPKGDKRCDLSSAVTF